VERPQGGSNAAGVRRAASEKPFLIVRAAAKTRLNAFPERPMLVIIGFGSLPSVSCEISDDPFPNVLFLYSYRRIVQATLGHGRGQAAFLAVPCGSITNFLAAPLSKSLYPCGASSNEMIVALHALAG
jgi:hypothetical protein